MFLPNLHRTQAAEITPGSDVVVPSAADARCLQPAYTTRMLPGGDGSAKRIFVLGDLDSLLPHASKVLFLDDFGL